MVPDCLSIGGFFMRFELLKIGPVTLYSYGFMIAVGILFALFAAEKRAKKYGLDADCIYSLAIWCLIGGMLGSKLLYLITELKDVIKDPSLLLDFSNGWVVYGGLIGGILGGFLYCKWKKYSFFQYFDLVMPSIALAQGFGRIGCFLAGCCYGKETHGWFGIAFHNSPYAPNNVKLIPTQLLSSAADFVHFFILIWFAKRAKADGQVAGLYLILYSIGRFLLEFLRNDPRGNISVLSTSQFISLFTLAAGLILFILAGRKSLKVKL